MISRSSKGFALGLIFASLLSGCMGQASRLAVAELLTVTPSETPIPIATFTALPTPTLTPKPAEICSPLVVQELGKLEQIITQPFQMPRVMPDGSYSDEGHHGLDLGYYTRDGALFTGTGVRSAFTGNVAGLVKDRPPYGNAIVIESNFENVPPDVRDALSMVHGDALYTLYGHLQNMAPLEAGMVLDCGEAFAETGLTGFTGGPHLHIEIRLGPPGQIFDSMGYYRADMSELERTNYLLWRTSGQFRLVDPITAFLLRAE